MVKYLPPATYFSQKHIIIYICLYTSHRHSFINILPITVLSVFSLSQFYQTPPYHSFINISPIKVLSTFSQSQFYQQFSNHRFINILPIEVLSLSLSQFYQHSPYPHFMAVHAIIMLFQRAYIL